MAKRGRPAKTKEPEQPEPKKLVPVTIKEIEGKFLIYYKDNVRAIRHTQEDAKEYIDQVS